MYGYGGEDLSYREGEGCVCWIGHAPLTVEPIMKILQGMPSTLRFILDHSLTWLSHCGITSGSLGAMLCALCFGKEEGGE